MMRDGAIGKNPEITVEGWYTLINALHHALPDIGWDVMQIVKDKALMYKCDHLWVSGGLVSDFICEHCGTRKDMD